MLEKFVKQLSKKSKVLILTHAGGDVDAVACAIALKEILPFSVVIGYPDHLNQNAVLLCQALNEKPVLNPTLSKFDALILVDFNSVGQAGKLSFELKSFSKPVLVLDHHEKESDSFKTSFGLIDPTALAASLVVFEEAKKAGLKLSKKAFKSISAGILSDTAMVHIADPKTLSVLSDCLEKSGLSWTQTVELFSISEPVSERLAKLRSANRMQLFEVDGFLVALSNVNYFESEAAAALVSLGCDVAFVAGIERHSNLLRLNSRASNGFGSKTKIALSSIMKKLVPFFGGHGNGHLMAAGYNTFHNETSDVLAKSLELLVEELKQKKKQIEVKEVI